MQDGLIVEVVGKKLFVQEVIQEFTTVKERKMVGCGVVCVGLLLWGL